MSYPFFSTAALAAGLLAWQVCAVAADTRPPPPAAAAAVEQLMDKDLVGVPGKELLMLTVEYLPGGASLPHRHDAQVFVYVLEGSLVMQVAGSPAVTLQRGQTFYENPTDVHVVSANASKTAPAKILVFIVKDKGAPVSRDAAPKAPP
jgi:quercetin dioxygenase-like cupin family protein